MRPLALAALVVSALAGGCSSKTDRVVEVAETVRVTEAEIERDPAALLPGGAVGLIRLEVPALLAAPFGARLRSLVEQRVPVPPSAGFDPGRDLSTILVGVYSMQGADAAAVALGRFDPAAIERAADGVTQTPLGAPLVRTSYARRTLYVSRNVGFTVLTPRVVLFGNETGIRRALDRLAEGRLAHDVPAWVDDLFRTPGAPVAAAFDLAGQPPVRALVQQLPFLQGLRTARVLGNLQPPGLNVAATATYQDAAAADAGVRSLLTLYGQLRSYSFFLSLAGIDNPVQRLEAQPVGADARVVAALEGRAVEKLLVLAANHLGAPGPTVPAQSGPATLPGGRP
ncbi:MAG: hypothetical protein FJ104_07245 [Deltaproteobacteria bacterium]|nr:hypothetical protein [Deltaproteobacteria bacterium]